jgi:hypothetical protein
VSACSKGSSSLGYHDCVALCRFWRVAQSNDSMNSSIKHLTSLIHSHCRRCRFLNSYFPGWYTSPAAARLPFGYNAQRTMHWMTHEKAPGYWKSIQPLKVS